MEKLFLVWLFLLLLPLATRALAEEDEGRLPSGGRSVLPDKVDLRTRFGGERFGKVVPLDEPRRPAGSAVRVHTVTRPPKTHQIYIKISTASDVRRGDVCVAVFEARTITSEDESGSGRISCFFEETGRPWKKSLREVVSVGAEWTRVQLPFVACMDYKAGKARLGLGFGFYPQVVEVRGARVVNYGRRIAVKSIRRLPRPTYPGMEPEAPWRKEAAERIEKYRRADFAVKVVTKRGRPVRGANVKIEMRRHAFGFGSAVTSRLLTLEGEDGQRYREIVRTHFNKIVFENDLKWRPWLKGKTDSNSRYARDKVLKAMTWLGDHGILIRGHWMMHNVLDRNPLWKQGRDKPEELKRQIAEHIRDETAALKGRLVEWDAINHLVGWGRLTDEIIGRESYPELVQLMHSIDPHAKLYVNEGNVLPGGEDDSRTRRGAYYDYIRYLLDNGAPLSGVGFMGHFSGASLTNPATFKRIYDRFAGLGLDLQVTEFDIDTTDEDLQAAYMRDFLTVTFSHPKVVGVIMWGFWQGQHWKPNAALWRPDWSVKPSGQAWESLVLRDWWTVSEGKTGRDGRTVLRGFLGDYVVTVKARGVTKTLDAKLPIEGTRLTVKLE